MSAGSASPMSPHRIPRTQISSPRKHSQNVITQHSPVRGRNPIPKGGIFMTHEVRIQSTPRSPVKVNFHSYENSHPYGCTAEFNDGASNNIHWPSSQEEYCHRVQDELPSTTPPPPPKHYRLPQQQYISSFSEDFEVSAEYTNSPRTTKPNHEMHIFGRRRQSPPPNQKVYGGANDTQRDNNVGEVSEGAKVQPLSNNSAVRSFSESSRAPTSRPRNLNLNAENGRQRVRPVSSHSAFSFSDMGSRGRSPHGLGYIPPPSPGLRVSSTHSRGSTDNRNLPTSLNASYPQSPTFPVSLGESNSALRPAVGSNASLLSTPKTLAMYLQNIPKTNDPATQYDFAMVMIQAAREAGISHSKNSSSESLFKNSEVAGYAENSHSQTSADELLRQARRILKGLADRSYPLAQYFLADGYASGFFAKGKPDNDRAFPLFVAASKHGHSESGYRAGLCYEHGWGCKKDFAKAYQFYLQSASKNHPGAMTRLGRACIWGDLGVTNKNREGVKWLKRAQESADIQYNSAPYLLGRLFEEGFAEDIFKDEPYAVRLFTQAADLGCAEAAYRLGDAYEHGKLSCPRDAGLSVHFYNLAAQGYHPKAMMGLCAWYTAGAEPILEVDHDEAFEWAMRAANQGYPPAEYAVGCFTEMGLGCRCDPLEANVWYIRAADHGEPRAKTRLQTINRASTREETGGGPKGRKLLTPSNSSLRLNSIDANTRSRTNTPTGMGQRDISKSNHLEVPDRIYSLKSDTPNAVTSGGPRFSLGESPQRPKRGVLRKTRVQSDMIVGDEDDMSSVGGLGNVNEKRDAVKDGEKKEKGWFSGRWN